MRSSTDLRRTRLLVTKIIHLTIETGSFTGIYFALSSVVRTLTPLTSSCYGFAQLRPPFIAFPHRAYFVTPGLLVPKAIWLTPFTWC